MMYTDRRKVCHDILVFGGNQQLTPEAKYFLIRIVYLYGDSSVTKTVEDLAKTVGLSKAALTKARSLLSDLGYIEVSAVPNFPKEKGGRPRFQIRIKRKFLDEICSYADQRSNVASREHHQKLMDKLLFWLSGGDVLRARNIKKIKKTAEESSTTHTFTITTRILLAVLYSHADPCGVVIKLGLSRLSRLIGISGDRLESQLKIINNLGYLIDRVSGVTGKIIFGRAAGAFYMNISDDDCKANGSFTLITFDTNIINPYNEQHWGFRLGQYYKNNYRCIFNENHSSSEAYFIIKSIYESQDISAQPSDDDEINWFKKIDVLLNFIINFLKSEGIFYGMHKVIDDPIDFFTGIVNNNFLYWFNAFFFFKLRDFFADCVSSNFSKYLQIQIEQYAALILNHGWQKIKIEKLVIMDDVLGRITSDLFPKSLDGDDQERARRSAMALFLYCIAYQQALMVKAMILKAEIVPKLSTNDQRYCYFAILPPLIPIDRKAKQIIVAIRGGFEDSKKQFYGVQWTGSGIDRIDHLEMKKFSESEDLAACQKFFSEFSYDIAALQNMTK